MVHTAPQPDWEAQLRRAYTTFDLIPFWDPDLHPRDEKGRWREVRGRVFKKQEEEGRAPITGDDAYDMLRSAGYNEDDAADYAMRGHLWTDDGEQFVWMPSKYGKSDVGKKSSLDRYAATRELRALETKREQVSTMGERAKPGYLEHIGMTQEEYTARWEAKHNYQERSAQLRKQVEEIDRAARANKHHTPDPRGDKIAEEGLPVLKDVMDNIPAMYRTMPDGTVRPMIMEAEDIEYPLGGHANMNGKNAFTIANHQFGRKGGKGDGEWHMPAAGKVSELKYTIAHELGHVFDYKDWEGPYDDKKHTELIGKARNSPHMSRYGREGGMFEARAEAFAQWVLEDQFLGDGGNPIVGDHEWLYNWDLDPEEIAELKQWLIRQQKKKEAAARAK